MNDNIFFNIYIGRRKNIKLKKLGGKLKLKNSLRRRKYIKNSNFTFNILFPLSFAKKYDNLHTISGKYIN